MFTRRTKRVEFLHELESLLVQGHNLVLFDVEVAEVKSGHLSGLKTYTLVTYKGACARGSESQLSSSSTFSARSFRFGTARASGIRIVKVSIWHLTFRQFHAHFAFQRRFQYTRFFRRITRRILLVEATTRFFPFLPILDVACRSRIQRLQHHPW
jgi:hypothetical protein